MTKDAVATMGGILPEDAGGRDAVHVAVFSAVSDEKLHAGQPIAVLEHGQPDEKVTGATTTGIAIVDPFIAGVIAPGQRFWAYLYPRTITALSHRWSHPAFEDAGSVYAVPAQKLAAEEALKAWANSADCPGYEWFIAEAVRLAKHGDGDEYLHVSGDDAHGEIPAEMWRLAEVVTGQPIRGERPKYFSCSC